MDNAQKKVNILNVIANLTREISVTDSLEKMINTFTTRFYEIFPYKHLIIWLLKEELNQLIQGYSTIPGDRSLSLDEENMVTVAVREDRTIYVSDFSLEQKFSPFMEGCLSAIVIPLSSYGKVRGAIHVESHNRGYFGDETILYLNVLANQLAVSLRNYHLFNQIGSLKSYLDDIIEKVNAVMIIMDPVGRIKRVNKAAEALTGFSAEELSGTIGINLIASQERKKQFLSFVPRIRNGEFISGVEVDIATKGGEKRYCLFNLGGILEGDYRLKEIIAIGQDITQMKDTEMKLMQAEKLALVGQLATSIIHEINNPLALISSYAQVMLKKSESEGRVEDVNKIRVIIESADRLTQLVQNLMNFVRPASNQFVKINLNQAIDEAMKWVEPMLRKGNVRILKEFDKDLPAVKGNKTEIQQVFLNLMSNAIYAMSTRVGTIRITTERVNNSFAAMVVSDEGTGIKPSDLKKIFDPFFTTKPEGKGTGLGLSIVKRIVERHNGRIVVKSKFGEGTSIKILFPLAQEVSK